VGDTETLGGLREALPKACRVVADAQAWWQMGKAVYPEAQSEAWANRLAERAPVWLAEPFHPDDLQGRQRITATKAVPIASGEHESRPDRLHALGESCVDVLQVNVMQLGGLISSRPVLQSLAERGQQFVLTGATTPLEVVALAHLASGFSEKACVGIDWPCFSSPLSLSLLVQELSKQPLPIESGSLRVSDGPGFGVEVDEAVLHRFPWKSGAASCIA
jgi:L-alanine-DL-glutamate epimerase-like enolase superfamily enzyme